MPVLFYALCLLCVWLRFEDKLQVILAWAYVLLRCASADSLKLQPCCTGWWPLLWEIVCC